MPISKENAQQGDIISFHKIKKSFSRPDGWNCEHFAVISDVQNEKINIKSKWGIMGVFEGNISELPETYGNVYVIWRRKNKNSPTEKLNSVKDTTVR
jgi:hypothetical protein